MFLLVRPSWTISDRCPADSLERGLEPASPLALAPGQLDEVGQDLGAVRAETVVFVLARDPRAKSGDQPGCLLRELTLHVHVVDVDYRGHRHLVSRQLL